MWGASLGGEVVTSMPQRWDAEERGRGGQAGGLWGPRGAAGASVLRQREPRGGATKRETPSALHSEELLRTVPWKMTLEREESRLEEGKGLALVQREVTKEGHLGGLSVVVRERGQGPGQPLHSRRSEGNAEEEKRMERGCVHF